MESDGAPSIAVLGGRLGVDDRRTAGRPPGLPARAEEGGLPSDWDPGTAVAAIWLRGASADDGPRLVLVAGGLPGREPLALRYHRVLRILGAGHAGLEHAEPREQRAGGQ